MKITELLAKHLKEIHFGGNWSCSNLKDQLKDVSWERATKQVDDLNSIATLSFHSTYYVHILREVLEGKGLNGKDNESFQVPNISNQKEWQTAQDEFWKTAEETAKLLEDLDDSELLKYFEDEKYGNYFRNVIGIIEHLHYHLGQIALIKKLV